MPIILSLSQTNETLWASGPQGLYRVENGILSEVAQPQHHLYCSLAVGSRLLVGGQPHGLAYNLDEGQNWQAAWLDGVAAPLLCLAAHPNFEQMGVILAGSEGAGLLRTTDRGRRWTVCNFGLQDYTVLALAWAPLPPATAWPQWEVVWAASENGLYRSPNGGLGWRRCAGAEGAYQTLAVSPNFHNDGLVLAGSAETGLWCSTDGGRCFESVTAAPPCINALAAIPTGWLLSDDNRLWQSGDGQNWLSLPDSKPALALLATAQGVWAGGEEGVTFILTTS